MSDPAYIGVATSIAAKGIAVKMRAVCGPCTSPHPWTSIGALASNGTRKVLRSRDVIRGSRFRYLRVRPAIAPVGVSGIIRSIPFAGFTFSTLPPSPVGATRRRATMACHAHTMTATVAMLTTSLMAKASQRPWATSHGIDHAQPNGVHPMIRPTLTGTVRVTVAVLVTTCIPRPRPQHNSMTRIIIVSQNRRLAITADIATSRRFDAIMAADHPSRTPSTAVTIATAPALDHARTCETDATRVTTPPQLNSPTTTKAGMSSLARLEKTAYRDGSV